MSGVQGLNIAELQAQQRYQDSQGEKSGFGLGYSDSVATVIDGMKWILNFHEGAIPAYCNVFEGLINGSSLVTLLGKSGNMFGIKFLENLAEYFSNVENEGSAPLEKMDIKQNDWMEQPNCDDYPYASSQIAERAEGLHDVSYAGDHRDQYFFPHASPMFIWNNAGKDLGI